MRLGSVMLALALLAGGCAHYEYDIVAPPDLARHIGTKADTVLQLDPLEYRLRTVDNQLVVQIFNPTDDPFHLLGDRSTVVDPENQSHPLRSLPIAPHSFGKVILPPPRPEYYDSGPTFGFGVGISQGYPPAGDYPYRDPFTGRYDYGDGPRYLGVVDSGNPYYWDWSGEGEARLTLILQRDASDKLITQQFTFRRRKM